jgi:hypothetical protein
MLDEIAEVKTMTASVLHECANEPLLKEKMAELMDPNSVDVLKKLNIKKSYS